MRFPDSRLKIRIRLMALTVSLKGPDTGSTSLSQSDFRMCETCVSAAVVNSSMDAMAPTCMPIAKVPMRY